MTCSPLSTLLISERGNSLGCRFLISWTHTFLIVVARTCAVTSRKAKEARTIPSGAGDCEGDLREAIKGLAVPGKAVSHHHDPLRLSIPLPDQDRAERKLGPLMGIIESYLVETTVRTSAHQIRSIS
jgi:hypothetical protein